MISIPSQIPSRTLAWYRAAKLNGEIPFWIVFAIAIYIPFEEFILRWIPAPGIILILLRFLHELALYLLLLRVFQKRFLSRGCLVITPIDRAIVSFLAWSIILIVVHQASIFWGLDNLRTLLRYVSVYYILANINLSKKQVLLLLKTILFLGLFQGCLVSVQYFAGPSFNSLFVSQIVNIDLGNVQIHKSSEVSNNVLKSGAVFGTFATTVGTASFLIVSLVLLVVFIYKDRIILIPKLKDAIGILIMCFALFATYKRTALLVATLIPILVLIYLRKRKSATQIIWLYSSIVFLILLSSFLFLKINHSIDDWTIRRGASFDVLSYFLQFFTPEYWQSEGTRQWIVKTTFRGIIETGNWFGLSPDREQALRTLANLIPEHKTLILDRMPWFEDVYWCSILLYYGIPGLLLFIYILQRLYQTAKWLIIYSSEREDRWLGIAFCTLTVIAVLYSFIESIFEVKGFSFYFWLLAGLVINAYCRCRKQFLAKNYE